MDVNVRAQAHGAALRARPPIGHQLVAEQELALRRPQPRVAARGALPYARVVADERPVGAAPEVFARDETVRQVLAGEGLIVDARGRVDELVPVHVAADEPRAICDAVRK